MTFRPIERWLAGIRAPLKIKLQLGFLLVIGVPLLMGVVSLLAIADIREHARQLVGVVGFVAFSVALALMLGSILASSILHPVRKMDAALERIAQGDFVTLNDVVNRDELGSLLNNLNRTSRRLSELYAEERQTVQALREQLAALEHAQAQLRQAQTMNPVPVDEPSRGRAELRAGRETILLVEDEDGVRELAREVLQGHGYTVIEARDGESALQTLEHRGERLHLLLTDVMMPKMGGPELARRLISRHPDVKVLYMSGYPDGALGEHGVLEPGAILLLKPFTPQGLVDKVRQVLDGTPRPTNL
jgi:CheY-like chemotaxis protein